MAQGLKRLLWKYGDLSVCPEYKMGTDTSCSQDLEVGETAVSLELTGWSL